jgi:hypothetical protein
MEPARDRRTDAARSAGDEHDFALQRIHRVNSLEDLRARARK